MSDYLYDCKACGAPLYRGFTHNADDCERCWRGNVIKELRAIREALEAKP